MTTQQSTSAAGHRGLLIGFAGGALVLGALSWLTSSAPPAQPPGPRVASPVDQWESMPAKERQEPDGQEPESNALVRPVVSAPSMPHEEPRRPAASALRFLGKMNTGNETTIVLFGSGRTFKAHGPGPIEGSEYVVDDLQDRFLVVRNTRLGTSQTIDFTPPVQPASNWSPEDSPQD
jgi:hypothetical protein